jgi:hypothetical protein
MRNFKQSVKILAFSCAIVSGLNIVVANAQTANMTATATVQNTLTLATPSQLNFGSIVAVSDTANTATATVSTLGVLSVATGGAPAYTAIVDDSAALNGQVTVADGADGAIINITINNVVDPVNGTESFVLDDFETSWNGNAAESQVIGATFTENFSSIFGGGTNTLDIGATITTTTVVAAAYGDGAYNGTYDVIMSY